MPLPKSSEARLYYRCAAQRYQDSQLLIKGNRTTGAVYFAGYAIECMLKSLLLEATSRAKRMETMANFRGGKGHDLEYLRRSYYLAGGARFPVEVNLAFTNVESWSTDLRYVPREL